MREEEITCLEIEPNHKTDLVNSTLNLKTAYHWRPIWKMKFTYFNEIWQFGKIEIFNICRC